LAFGVVPCSKSKSETVGKWDEPNQKVLEELMMQAYRNRDTIRQQALSKVASTKAFTWQAATQKLVDLIPAGRLLQTPEWVLPEVNVEIQVVRNVNAFIGNATYVLKPGETYVVPENVHEVLSFSGAVV